MSKTAQIVTEIRNANTLASSSVRDGAKMSVTPSRTGCGKEAQKKNAAEIWKDRITKSGYVNIAVVNWHPHLTAIRPL